MKRALILSLAVVLASCLSASAAAARALDYTSRVSGFRINVPARPKIERKRVDLPEGESATLRLYTGDLTDDTVYSVLVMQFPEGFVARAGRTQMLDNTISRTVKAAKGKVVSNRRSRVNGRTGREVFISAMNGQATVRLRAFVVDDRVYQVITISPRDKGRSEEVNDFFDSFEFIGDQD